jgi:hypothetical protein
VLFLIILKDPGTESRLFTEFLVETNNFAKFCKQGAINYETASKQGKKLRILLNLK